MVKGVSGASVPPARNLSAIPAFSQANPLASACKAVLQVIEWLITGPEAFRSCATQEEIFPSVVVGEERGEALPFFRKISQSFSSRLTAPREEPILIPISASEFCQPAMKTACREACNPINTERSSDLNSRFSLESAFKTLSDSSVKEPE